MGQGAPDTCRRSLATSRFACGTVEARVTASNRPGLLQFSHSRFQGACISLIHGGAPPGGSRLTAVLPRDPPPQRQVGPVALSIVD